MVTILPKNSRLKLFLLTFNCNCKASHKLESKSLDFPCILIRKHHLNCLNCSILLHWLVFTGLGLHKLAPGYISNLLKLYSVLNLKTLWQQFKQSDFGWYV